VLGDVIPFIATSVVPGTGRSPAAHRRAGADRDRRRWLFYRPVVAVGILVIGGIALPRSRIARQRRHRRLAAG